MITILCADTNSVYKNIRGIDVYDRVRNAYNFTGSNPVITHAPCAAWSRLRMLSGVKRDERNLAFFCWERVQVNGGIFEHPYGSSFFKEVECPAGQLVTVDQFDFGFPARKRTWLYFNKCVPLPYDKRPGQPTNTVVNMNSRGERSRTTWTFAKWLIRCVEASDVIG